MYNKSNLQCPFCLGKDFDSIGLKRHLEMRRCEPYNAVPAFGVSTIPDYLCPDCHRPYPENETILSNGELGCSCHA